jgi:hypothetical protein
MRNVEFAHWRGVLLNPDCVQYRVITCVGEAPSLRRVRVKEQIIAIGSILLGFLLLQSNTAACSYIAFEEDVRLQVKCSLRLNGVSIRDALAQLERDTGIRFFADSTVIDERITLYTHHRPLAEIMSAMADFFHFAWKQEGKPGHYTYTLYQTEAARKQEAAFCKARAQEVGDLIAQEVAAFARWEPASDSQLREHIKAIGDRLLREKEPQRRRALLIDSTVCAELVTRPTGRALINRFLQGLSSDEVASLIQAGTTIYAWPAMPGCREISPKTLETIRRTPVGEVDGTLPLLTQANYLFVKLSGRLGRGPGLHWSLTVGEFTLNNRRTASYSGFLPSTGFPVEPSSADQVAPEGWQKDPQLNMHIRLASLEKSTLESTRQSSVQGRALGTALGKLGEGYALDIIADCFWPGRISQVEFRDVPLGEVLTALARMSSHRWWRQDGFIMMQSTLYALDRRAEPPATALDRWRERAKAGSLELDDYAEMAALPEPQLDTLVQMGNAGDFPESLMAVSQARYHLALWNALTRAQQRRAKAEGLPYSELNSEQRRLYTLAATDPVAIRVSVYLVNASLKASRLRVYLRENRYWGLRRDGNSSLSGFTNKEDALRQFQLADPSIQAKDLEPVTLTSIIFIYQGNEGDLARGWFSLSPRWNTSKEKP